MDQNNGKSSSESPKVVNLFASRKPTAEESMQAEASKPVDSAEFLESMRKNADNAERLRKERLKANQGVLKSYRIKN